LSPGIYQLTSTLVVDRPLTVLGIGMATVIPPVLKSALVVADGVKDVRLAGILFQAATQNTGNPQDTQPTQPLVKIGGYQTILSDLFTRVGGPHDQHTEQARADVQLLVTGDGVILDNSWLWRADHTISGNVKNGDCPSYTALQVDGSDFVAYGLKSEHTLRDLSVFNGENAKVYFYQSELPYDVESGWNYASYKVADHIQHHLAVGLGTYSIFQQAYNAPNNAFVAPKNCGIDMKNLFTLWLGGSQGAPKNVIGNEGGQPNSGTMQKHVCTFEGSGNCGPTPRPTTPHPTKPGTKSYCVPKTSATEAELRSSVNWACQYGGIDCTSEPSDCRGDSAKDATYAFSKYYALKHSSGGTCDFYGAAELSSNPAYPNCVYQSAALEEEKVLRKIIRYTSADHA